MNTEKFTEAVTKRAHDRVQNKIKVFKAEVATSLNKLFGGGCSRAGLYHFTQPEDKYDISAETIINEFVVGDDSRKVLEVLASKNCSSGWPSNLWRDEEKMVQDEMFAMMNEVERALMAKGPKEGDDMPEVPAPATEKIS